MRLFCRIVIVMVIVTCGRLTLFAYQSQQLSGPAESQEDKLAQQGEQALAAGNFDAAEAAFLKLSKMQPGVAEVYANLGAIYFQQGKFEASADALRHALKLKPAMARAKTLLAISLSEQGKTAEALPGLEAGFHSPGEIQIRRMCGLQLLRAFTALHRDADAVATGLALNKLFPDDAEILYQTGRIYGNFTYLTMERLRDRAPDSVWMLQAAAEAQESEKDYDAAIRSFEAVLRIEPQRPGVHYRMGRVYLARFESGRVEKDREDAEAQFRSEIAIDPNNGNAAYELAQILADTGKQEAAQREFEALVAHRPDFEQARVGYAEVLMETGNASEATAQLKRAVELDPNDEVAWYRLVRALRSTGDPVGQKKAMAEYQRVHALQAGKMARAGVLLPVGEVTPQHLGPAQEP